MSKVVQSRHADPARKTDPARNTEQVQDTEQVADVDQPGAQAKGETQCGADPATARRIWMGLLARAPSDRLASLFAELPESPGFDWLRAPEVGGVMVRGRAGGTGAPFNLGEMTVTRCALRLGCGTVGHGYVQGRDKAHAERAALVDALMQGPRAAEICRVVLTPLEVEEASARADRAVRAGATKVDFFTMVRGES